MKTRLIVVIGIFILIANLLHAQKEAYNWYFGQKLGISFNTTDGKPKVLTDGVMGTNEGVGTISDSDGNLLFYSDGLRVWNKNHKIMPNGTGLKGDPSTTQSCIIVPLPDTKDIYYLFTLDAAENYRKNMGKGLNYNIIDLKLDNGLGDIVSDKKNISLLPDCSEKITAVQSSNLKNIWIIVHGYGNNYFYVYLVSNNTVSLHHIDSIGSQHSEDYYHNNRLGYLKNSSKGDKLAAAIFGSGIVELFDFNNTTGKISNPVKLMIPNSYCYGVEFSPDQTKLYASVYESNSISKIYQFDLLAGNETLIQNSKVVISSNSSAYFFSALQIGPDGKIYIAHYYSKFIGAVLEPNKSASDCLLIDNYISFQNGRCIYGLPVFFRYIDGYKIASNSPVCEGENINLFLEDSNFDNVNWIGPNGFVSTEQNPVIRNAKAEMSGWYHSSTTKLRDSIYVTVNPNPKFRILPDSNLIICQSKEIELKPSNIQDNFSYSWSTGDTTASIIAHYPGVYTLIITDSTGCSGIASSTISEMKIDVSGLSDIDFGRVNIDNQDKKTIILTNNSNGKIKVEKIYLKNSIKEITIETNPKTPVELDSGSIITVNIDFKPDYMQNYMDSLIVEISEPCHETYTSQVSGDGISKLTLWLPDIKAEVDEDICIPLKGKLQTNSNIKLVTKFDAVVAYDASAFYTSNQIISSALDANYLINNQSLSIGRNTLLIKNICGKVLMPLEKTSDLKINSFILENQYCDVEIINGSITIDACAFKISHIISSEKLEITLTPNPAEDEITIKYKSSNNGIMQMKVYNPLGMEVENFKWNKQEISSEYKCDVSNLVNGIYFYQVVENDGIVARGRFIVNK